MDSRRTRTDARSNSTARGANANARSNPYSEPHKTEHLTPDAQPQHEALNCTTRRSDDKREPTGMQTATLANHPVPPTTDTERCERVSNAPVARDQVLMTMHAASVTGAFGQILPMQVIVCLGARAVPASGEAGSRAQEDD